MNNLSNSLLKNIISYYEKNVNPSFNTLKKIADLNAGFDLDTIR